MIGKTFSHYRILEKLGEGGMGVVYKAEDTKLKRQVALKFLPAELTRDAEAKARFIHEAQAASALEHPNICTIHDIQESSEGQLFMVMPCYEGQTLRQMLDEVRAGRAEPLQTSEAIEIAVQIGEGLALAHEKGIVHRDLKPANVFVIRDGVVKILDFGIAKLAGGQTKLTKTGTTMGTAAYMSPEQAMGKEVDRRADIWSLGVVLYEMLAGRLPFQGDYEQALIYSIINEVPEPLSKSRPDASAGIEQIVNHALAKNPADRYQTMEEFLADLKAVAEGLKPLKARRQWARGKIFGIKKIYVYATLAVVSVLFGLNAGGIRDQFFRLLGSGPVRAIRLAVLPFANLSGDPEQEYLSDGLTQEMITQLGRIHPSGLNVIARTSVLRYKKAATPIDQIGRELGVTYVLEGSAQRDANRVRISAELIKVKDQTRIWTDTYEQDLSGFRAVQSEVAQGVARALALKLLPTEQTRLTSVKTVNPAVYDAYLKGMFYVSQNNPEGFEKGMRFLHQAVEIDPAEPLAYAGLAQGYITLGHGGSEEADVYPRARAAAVQALKLDPEMAEAVGALAEIALYYDWDWAKAEELFKRALKLNPSLAMTHYHYAWYLALFDRLDEAIAEHKLARDFDPLRALNTGWLGDLYNYAGRYDEAIVEAKKALELEPDFWPSYYILRRAYSEKRMHKEAIDAARRLTELDPTAGKIQMIMAYVAAGQRDQALAIAPGLDKNYPIATLGGMAYLALGDKDTALQILETAYKVHQPTLPWVRERGVGWDAMFGDPRFQDLVRRMKLPMSEKK